MSAALLLPAVRLALEHLGIAPEVLRCSPDEADTAAFCTRYGVDPHDAANTIVVASRREPLVAVACVVLASTRLDVNGAVRRRLGVRRLSFATAEQTTSLTGMMIGGVTPFGLPAGLPVWIDSLVLSRAVVIIGGGNRTSKLRIMPAELLRSPGAESVEALALPPSHTD